MSGLKFLNRALLGYLYFVSPFAGEWIEIAIRFVCLALSSLVSPFAGEWIEIRFGSAVVALGNNVSPFAGEWIEINHGSCSKQALHGLTLRG